MRRLVFLLAVVSLTGCQSMFYREPAGDSTARVIFTSNNIAAQPMICVPGKGFRPTEYALSQKPFDAKTFTDINQQMKKVPEVSVRVPTDRGLIIGVQYNSPSSTPGGTRDRCHVAVHFQPQSGHTYQAEFVRPGGQCGLSLTNETGQVVSDAVLAHWHCK